MTQQKFKDILEAAIVSTPEEITYDSPINDLIHQLNTSI